MSSEESVEFDLNELYDILTSINIKEKLKPFVRQFKKKNLPFIYETMLNIIQVFNSKKEMPLMKFNALMATKLFFDTGQFIPIVLIQIYLLPIIFQVALYRIQKRSEEGLTLYFIEKGYDSTKQMKRIGFNYVLLALEFIFMSAQVKPYRNLQKMELKQMSSYAKFAKTLLQKGVKTIQTYKFYLPSYVNQSRKRYMKKLSKFNPEQYIDFIVRMICEELNLNKKPEIDLKKMMTYGDAFLTIPIMNICEEQLDQMQTNFPNKKKYLNLLGEFVRAGDIYAVLTITRSSFLQSIFQKVQMVRGEIGLDVGDKIYPQVQASKSDKRQFYIQYLKHVEIWASCHPIDQDGGATLAKKIFDILKVQRKFVFPPNILLGKIKNQMEVNLKQNQQRNEKLIRLVDEGSAYESRKKNVSMKQSRASRKNSKLNRSNNIGSYIEFDQIQEMVVRAKKKLDLIIQKQKLPLTIASLQKFKKFWDSISQKKEIDVDESGDIEIVLQQGTLCVKIIELILPVYTLYQKKAINFDQYINRVGLLMKTEQPVSQEGQVSIQKDIVQVSVECIQTIRQQSQQHKNSFIANIRGSSLLQSKITSNMPPQLASEISEQSDIKINGVSKLKLNSFNDYQLPTYKNSLNDYKIKASQQNSDVKEELQPSNSYLKSSQNSKKIIQRRYNRNQQDSYQKNQFEQQMTYRDIINMKNNESSPKQKYQQSKQSFISLDNNSSLKEIENNKSNSSLSIGRSRSRNKRNSHLKKQSAINRQKIIKQTFIDDYYGSLQQKPFVNKPSNLSSKIDLKTNKKSQISKLQEKNLKSSIISKQTSSIKKYNSGSFQILQSFHQKQKSKQIPKQKKQSRFTFNSKDVNEVQSLDHLRDIPLSILSKYEKYQSLIQEPSINPLLHSFHQFKEQSITNPSKKSSFKQCFDINNEIISVKEGASRMFKFSKTGKIVNFVETVYSRQTAKNSSIFDMLSEKNAKQSIEFYRNQKQKNREAQTLSQRVKSLESFNKNMRMKFIMRRHNQTPKVDKQRSPRSTRQPLVEKDSEVVSFQPWSETQRQKSQNNCIIKRFGQSNEIFTKEQNMRTINTNIYKSYFPDQISQKLKKCMLKSKSLLLKNDEFEIGSVVYRRQAYLEYILFITPLKDKIEQVNMQVNQDQNVTIKIFKKYQDIINVNHQHSIKFHISVDNVPYVLPILNFKFKANRKYQHNQLLITIPCSFNKFFTFNKISQSFTRQFQNSYNDFIHISPVKYSNKILNPQKVTENFNNFNIIYSETKSNVYATEAYFKGKIFLLKLITNSRGTLQMQGKNMTCDHKNTKYLQFLMITLKQIIQISKS